MFSRNNTFWMGQRFARMLARGPVYAIMLTALLVHTATFSPEAMGQPILEYYSRTLTSYRGDDVSTVQNLWPQARHRGINLDGSLRQPSTQGWALAGNPFGEGWNGNGRLGDVCIDLGSYSPTDVDLVLPNTGVRWVIGRTCNGRQFSLYSSGESNSDYGYQGVNWMRTSQPEIAIGLGNTDADDVLYIIYGADRYIEFQRTGTGSVYFKAKNGGAGLIKYTASSAGPPNVPEKYEYFDQNGTTSTFFGATYAGAAAYQIWKIQDAAGNKAYVGDSSSMLTAIGFYADGSGSGARQGPSGAIRFVYDQADRQYTYTYSSSAIGSEKRLLQVKVETKTGGTWASSPTGVVTVGQVDYDYYTGTANDVGQAGDLKMVTITTPLTDSGVSLIKKSTTKPAGCDVSCSADHLLDV